MVAHGDSAVPVDFVPGEEIGRTGQIDPASTKHIKWIAKLGSQAYGNPVVADGKVYVGTNNASPRDPKYKSDRATLYCLDEASGELIWQLNVPKLGAGKVSDWEYLGICSSPAVVGDVVYLVTNLCEVVALDADGLADGNDGLTDEAAYYKIGDAALSDTDADVLWRYDMREELGVFPHNITSTSPLVVDGRVYVATSNGVDWSHVNIVNPQAPAMIALDARTGALVGEEGAGISKNLMHCNWSSPAFANVEQAIIHHPGQGDQEQIEVKTIPTVFFGGGDGFLYGFDPETKKDDDGFDVFPVRWKIDGNPRKYRTDEQGEPIKYATAPGPSEFIATPVYHDGVVFCAVGQDPEHGEGVGALSAVHAATGELIWRDETIERSISTVAVHDGLVFASDYSGWLRCYDAKTGELYWEHNTLAHIWGSPLVADGKVLLGNEDGILTIMAAEKEKTLIAEVEFNAPIYSSPVLANGTTYIATQTHLYAIAPDAE
jgi:outer membrane protein assembly factor BamB